MKILAINTSTKLCSVGLLIDKKIFKYCKICCISHNQHILYMIDKILNKNFLKIKDINIISYNLGPGSFTGLRIGLAISQSLSFVKNIRIIGLSSLAIIAQNISRIYKKKKILSLINIKKNIFFYNSYTIKKNGFFHEKKNFNILSFQDILYNISKLNDKWVVVSQNNIIKQKIILSQKEFFKVPYPLVEDMIYLVKLIIEKKTKLNIMKKNNLIY